MPGGRRRARLTEAVSREFWQQRPTHTINTYPGRDDAVASMHATRDARNARMATKKATYIADHPALNIRPEGCRTTASHIEFWAIHRAWTFCSECKALTTERLLPDFRDRPVVKTSSRCACTKPEERYITPKYRDFPLELRGLNQQEVLALRPLVLHSGPYLVKQHGYRVKTRATTVSWDPRAPLDKINALDSHASRVRTNAAYVYLMASPTSSYKTFVDARKGAEDAGHLEDRLYLHDNNFNGGIECALWPTLYPKTTWCETTLKGDQSRISAKRSFLTKVLSEVVDYALDFEMLQFHFDRFLFKTVSAAVSVGERSGKSPATSLANKPFSPEYWMDQHRYLVDALRQFGYPTLFLTISPYEWTFPYPIWLEGLREQTGRGPTQLAAYETPHIMNTLEQVVRGYLTGSNDKSWHGHVFRKEFNPAEPNVVTYFYRFEFQERGTVHLHMLVWLEDLKKIATNVFRADIPSTDPDLAHLVSDLQRSDRGALPLNEAPTTAKVVQHEGPYGERSMEVLSMYHPAEAFALNLRAYISTLLPALKCRMDVQTTDGKGKVLRYVTSYVAKSHDALSSSGMYNNVDGHAAAYRYVQEQSPCEPEMWVLLNDRKISWSSSTRRAFCPPRSTNFAEHDMVQKYWKRPPTQDQWSFLVWLRRMNLSAKPPRPYDDGCTALVGVKYLSLYNEQYFFQHVLLNTCHRRAEDLKHPLHDAFPPCLAFFAAAALLLPQFWENPDSVYKMLSDEGNRDSYCFTATAFVKAKHDTLKLWRLRVLTNQQLEPLPDVAAAQGPRFPLLGQQIGAKALVLDALDRRSAARAPGSVDDREWRRPIVVRGKPGTGKTQVVLSVVDECVTSRNEAVLIATPTGFLASRYRAIFGADADVDTIHATFKVPVGSDATPTTNWAIARYDLVVVDEVSMVPQRIFQHVLQTLAEVTSTPVLLITGDESQLQPIDTVDNRTVSVSNIMGDRDFRDFARSVILTQQHRCTDPEYEQALDHLRHLPPSDAVLHYLHGNRVLCPDGDVNMDLIVQHVVDYPETKVLTVSRKAAVNVNDAVLQRLFTEDDIVASFRLDDDQLDQPIFRDMRVMITQNRDKERSVVNGQVATVAYAEGHTIFLRLDSGIIVPVHPVTPGTSDMARPAVLPFVAAYAMTICKAQGQTLSHVLLWMDCDFVPDGCGYVALSRVKKSSDIFFVTPLRRHHLSPVKL